MLVSRPLAGAWECHGSSFRVISFSVRESRSANRNRARKLYDFGVGTYIRNLLTHLSRIDRHEYVLLWREND